MATIKEYQEGYNAGLFGESKLACPYQQGTSERKKWLEGHKRGDELVWFLAVNPEGKVKKNA